MTGNKLGNYEVLDKLGEGGMGEVWRARDSRLNRAVAVKLLPAVMAADPVRRQRFEQEARSLGALNHPNIVAVYDIGECDGQAYIVSELVEGEPLRKILERGPLSGRRLIDVAVQIAEAMAAAHAVGVVHRDLKPENIMVSSAGRVKVLDFGLAKQDVRAGAGEDSPTLLLSQPGMVLGTVGYMSPEQVRGEPVDARSDIFSFGCVLYELVAGKRAFDGKSAADVMSSILKDEPPDISAATTPVPPAVEAIVRRCLEKNPAHRFQSSADLAFALRSLSNTTGVQAAMAPAARPWLNWWKLVLAGCAAVLLVAGGYLVPGRAVSGQLPDFQRITFRAGHVEAARFGPDGRTVVYAAHWDEGPLRLYLGIPGNPEARDLEVADDTRLLAVSSKSDLALLEGPFRPDGSGTLARANTIGGQPRQLLEDVRLADWSPDASEMAVVRMVNGKSRLEYPVGKVLGESDWGPFSIRISPDGQRVAYTDYEQGSRVGILVADRSGKSRLLGVVSGQTSSVHGASLAWTRDGSEIWFRGFDAGEWNSIRAINFKGEVRTVARFPTRVILNDLSNDGSVLLSSESGRLGILGLAPGHSVEQDLSCLESSYLRGISGDGTLILANVVDEGAGPSGSMYIRMTDGSAPVRMGDGISFGLSPDGKWASGYTTTESASRRYMLFPTGPGEQIAVTPPQLPPNDALVVGWLAGENNYLVQGAFPGKKWQFFDWDAPHGTLRPLTPDGMQDERVLVSPDGLRFLARGPDRELRVYSVDGAEPVPVPGLTPHDIPIGWRTGGHELYVVTHHDENRMIPVSLVDVQSGKRTPWKQITPSIPVEDIRNLCVTPDGRAYAYNYSFMRSDLYLARGIR